MNKNKIQSVNKLKKIITRLKKRRKKIVFANGCFDIIHIGHIKAFKKAKSSGDILVVAVNSNNSVHRIKGHNRPIVPAKYRMEILSSIDYVDYVVKFGEDTPLNIIKKLKPDIIVKGSDWKYSEVVGREYAKVVRIPLIRGWSTSNIIRKIKNIK